MSFDHDDRQDISPGRYHHGNLRAALIVAADRVLAEEGLEGFSLRKAAKRAGVSATAPMHHFGGAAGLLSEVALLGFEELDRHLSAETCGTKPVQRLRLQGIGYVRFAVSFPGRFRLMFRKDLLDPDHRLLRETSDRAAARLEETVRAMLSLSDQEQAEGADRALMLAAWSLVHGFAQLLLDGKFGDPGDGKLVDHLVEDVLPKVLESQWPDE